MSRPPDNTFKLNSDTISLCEYTSGGNKGFWLYDKIRGMNLSMRAESKDEAFVEALTYYQDRLEEVELTLKTLQTNIDVFVNQVRPEEPSEYYY